jgi:hypothetical protein
MNAKRSATSEREAISRRPLTARLFCPQPDPAVDPISLLVERAPSRLGRDPRSSTWSPIEVSARRQAADVCGGLKSTGRIFSVSAEAVDCSHRTRCHWPLC